MRPQLKTETITVEYWDCGNPDHRHKTSDTARACITRRDRRGLSFGDGKKRKDFYLKWTNETYAKLLEKHRSGIATSELADELKLSITRVGQIIRNAKSVELAAMSTDPFAKLSYRSRTCLQSEGFNSVADVRAAMEAGGLNGIKNMGDISKYEIRKWLAGFPVGN